MDNDGGNISDDLFGTIVQHDVVLNAYFSGQRLQINVRKERQNVAVQIIGTKCFFAGEIIACDPSGLIYFQQDLGDGFQKG